MLSRLNCARVQGLVHGDLKPLNCLRVRPRAPEVVGGAMPGQTGWLLIDLDAAAEAQRGYAGLKFSTAVSTLEMC